MVEKTASLRWAYDGNHGRSIERVMRRNGSVLHSCGSHPPRGCRGGSHRASSNDDKLCKNGVAERSCSCCSNRTLCWSSHSVGNGGVLVQEVVLRLGFVLLVVECLYPMALLLSLRCTPNV